VRGTEDTLLLEQVVNDHFLVPVDPAGEEQQEKGEGRRQAGPWPKRARETVPGSRGTSPGLVGPRMVPRFPRHSLLDGGDTPIFGDQSSPEFLHLTLASVPTK
jgi:hypothetical protein